MLVFFFTWRRPGKQASWKALAELSSIGMTLVLATVIGLAGGYYAGPVARHVARGCC